MPIDVEKVLGAELAPAESSWTSDDVILYHLGLGAGVPPTDPGELAYTYEKDLKVLPSYGVIPAFPAMFGMFGIDGLEVNLATLLHGEQDLEIHETLPTQADVVTRARVSDIFDKGKAALLILETVTETTDGTKLFTNRFSSFLRGEGGWGGESGPKSGNEAPEREPDHVVECPTMVQQALIYRLSGDKNPLHADPDFSKLGGFDTPILHGLCSYGIACKAAVDTALGGDVSKVGRLQARFAGVIFPGETLVVSIWEEGEQLLISASSKERDTPVLSNTAITLR